MKVLVKLDKKLQKYVNKKKDKPLFLNTFLNIFDKLAPETIFFAGEFKRLPIFFYYLGGFVWNFGWLALLIYFIYVTYQSTISSSYVSLQNDNGICSEVTLSATGLYRLDQYGYWESESFFKAQYSLMQATLKAYSSTTQDYTTLINNFGTKYENVSKKSMYRDLAYNMIVLSSAHDFVETKNGKFELEPTGSIGYMLDKQYSSIGTILDASDLLETDKNKLTCFGSSGGTVDAATNKLEASYSYKDASHNCKQIAKYLGHGLIYGQSGDEFHFSLDLASFSTAVAVNNKIRNVKNLISIGRYAYNYAPKDQEDDFIDDNRPVERRIRSRRHLTGIEKRKLEQIVMGDTIESYVDELLKQYAAEGMKYYNHEITSYRLLYAQKYTGMKPVICFVFDHDQENQAICFVYLMLGVNKFSMMYPVMRHYSGTDCYNESMWGSSWYENIPEILQNSSNWLDTYDHQVDILMGLVLIPNAVDAIAFAYEMHKIITSNENGDLNATNRFYHPMKIIIDSHFQNDNETTNDNTSLKYPSQDELCGKNLFTNESTINCFLIAINHYGGGFFINANRYQLFAGACRNSIYHSDMYINAANTPPTPLIQDYYSCVPDTFDAVFNSIGLSLGNAGLYMMVGWGFFCLLMTLMLYYFYGFDPKMHIYPQIEDDDDLEKGDDDISSDSKDEEGEVTDTTTLEFY